MFASLLTTLSFACSGLSAGRASKLIGGMQSLFWRTLLALCFLSLYASLFGQKLHGPGLLVFIVSGAVGFGFGDLALFESYSRIGARRTILLAQCLAAPIACLTEWAWLGTRLTCWEIFLGAVILFGVGISLAPSEHLKIPRPLFVSGVCFGVLAAAGQGWGAVLSRYAFHLNDSAGIHVDAVTATFQRMLGGAMLVLPVFAIYLANRRRRNFAKPNHSASGWLLAHALCGPVIGVSCFQWALSSTPSGIVLAIVATTPIAIMPLTHWFDGDRLTTRNLIGAAIAVGGVIGLILS
ncbi:MAG: DMT family transporter [Verrucomicrobiales bacterium]|jgi:drug/metabolite transporter (DMT)-like permease|nr:DMT family transporter [Verrucomicrobiales bacterium]